MIYTNLILSLHLFPLEQRLRGSTVPAGQCGETRRTPVKAFMFCVCIWSFDKYHKAFVIGGNETLFDASANELP
jgi:hypothetical protein